MPSQISTPSPCNRSCRMRFRNWLQDPSPRFISPLSPLIILILSLLLSLARGVTFAETEVIQRLDKLERVTKHVGVTSAADWVKLLRNGRYLSHCSILNAFLLDHSVNWWIEGAEVTPGTFPAPDATEVTTTQPFVSEMISKILNCKGFVHQAYKQKPSKFLTTKIKVKFVSIPCDGHANVSFFTRKPDVPCYENPGSGSCSITIVGDVKGGAALNKDFSDDSIGQILDMGRDLLKEVQFLRSFVYCFLTDGSRFQFFKCTRKSDGEFDFKQSSIYSRLQGWQVCVNKVTPSVVSRRVL
jgi:hypothetical protein